MNAKLMLTSRELIAINGLAIQRLVTGTIAVSAVPIRNSSLAIGVGCGAVASFVLRYRDARDTDWSPPIPLDSRIGSDILNAYRLGATRGPSRTFEISTISPTNIRISGAVANESWSV